MRGVRKTRGIGSATGERMARLSPRPGAPEMTNVLAVVGEHRDDPDHLLLLGDDGHYYDLRLSDGATVPIQLNEEWVVETPPEAATGLLG